jgi:uncharacterized cupin superfamily protein
MRRSGFSALRGRDGGPERGKARARAGSRYCKSFDEPCHNKTRRRLGYAAGLSQFAVNLLELGPGAWSSQRHWHPHEDEFAFVLRGPVVLVTEAGDTVRDTGDCAGFKAGERAITCRTAARRPHLSLKSAHEVPTNPMPNPEIDLRVNAQGYVHIHNLPPEGERAALAWVGLDG